MLKCLRFQNRLTAERHENCCVGHWWGTQCDLSFSRMVTEITAYHRITNTWRHKNWEISALQFRKLHRADPCRRGSLSGELELLGRWQRAFGSPCCKNQFNFSPFTKGFVTLQPYWLMKTLMGKVVSIYMKHLWMLRLGRTLGGHLFHFLEASWHISMFSSYCLKCWESEMPKEGRFYFSPGNSIYCCHCYLPAS